MTQLSFDNLYLVNGGGAREIATGVCGLVTVGDAVYIVGLASNWWNPIGWLSATLEVVSIGCAAWGINEALRYLAN